MYTTRLKPVRICAGALGKRLPKRDLLVSRQHRMLVSSKIAARMFGTREVLVSANKLTALPCIFVDQMAQGVDYIHLLFDNHKVVFVEGAQSESLYLGTETHKALTQDGRKEIAASSQTMLKAASLRGLHDTYLLETTRRN